MKIYLAGPIFNQREVGVMTAIQGICHEAGAETFSPYHASQPIWNGRAPKDCSDEERRQVLQQNIDYIHWCDILLCVLNRGGDYDGRTDTGVVWEMGYANALGTFTLGFLDPEVDLPQKGLNLMLAGTIDAVVASYTGGFTNFALGKQVGQDLLTKGSDVLFAAAGVDEL